MNRRLDLWAFVLAIYWVLLFVATHIPRVAPPPGMRLPRDDVLHFTAYFVLALLAAMASSRRRAITRREIALLATALIAFGALDEWTQTPVGRDASFADWIADAAGVLAGLMVFGACAAFLTRRDGDVDHGS